APAAGARLLLRGLDDRAGIEPGADARQSAAGAGGRAAITAAQVPDAPNAGGCAPAGQRRGAAAAVLPGVPGGPRSRRSVRTVPLRRCPAGVRTHLQRDGQGPLRAATAARSAGWRWQLRVLLPAEEVISRARACARPAAPPESVDHRGGTG